MQELCRIVFKFTSNLREVRTLCEEIAMYVFKIFEVKRITLHLKLDYILQDEYAVVFKVFVPAYCREHDILHIFSELKWFCKRSDPYSFLNQTLDLWSITII